MKRFLTMLIVFCLAMGISSVYAADAVEAKSYREDFIYTYSWRTGEKADQSHHFQVCFSNNSGKDLKTWTVSMRFYDTDGKLVATQASEKQNVSVKAGDSAWSPSITADAAVTSFTWKLDYTTADGKSSSTGWMKMTAPAKNTYLNRCRNGEEPSIDSINRPEQSGTVRRARFQLKYQFQVNNSNGKVSANLCFRTNVKNSGKQTFTSSLDHVSYHTSKGLSMAYSKKQSISIKPGTIEWCGWVQMPASAEIRSSTTFLYW